VTCPRSQPVFYCFAGVLVALDRAEIDRQFEFTGRFKPQFPSKPHPFVETRNLSCCRQRIVLLMVQ
jgi:hypothetical protein